MTDRGVPSASVTESSSSLGVEKRSYSREFMLGQNLLSAPILDGYDIPDGNNAHAYLDVAYTHEQEHVWVGGVVVLRG